MTVIVCASICSVSAVSNPDPAFPSGKTPASARQCFWDFRDRAAPVYTMPPCKPMTTRSRRRPKTYPGDRGSRAMGRIRHPLPSLQDVTDRIKSPESEGGNAIKVFTIAFGSDADKSVLQAIADPSGGKQYDSSPDTIQKIYDDIATFF